MKKKILGVFSVILVLTLCVFVYNPKEVSAGVSDKVCTEKEAYLMFADQQWVSNIEQHLATEDPWDYTACSSAGGIKDGNCLGSGSFEINLSRLGVSEDAEVSVKKEEVVNIENTLKTSDTSGSLRFWQIVKNNGTGSTLTDGKLYVNHGKWSNGTDTDMDRALPNDPAQMQSASFSDSISQIARSDYEVSGNKVYAKIQIKRSYSSSAFNSIKGNAVNVTGKDGQEHPVLYAPLLYKVTFNVCDTQQQPEVKNPTLTIRYWYDEVGGKKAAEDHSETLASGSKYDVTSPSISGYSPDKDVVRGTMPDEDVIIDVIYTPKTGGVAMGFIWFIGLGALGYGIYYYNRTTREQEEI